MKQTMRLVDDWVEVEDPETRVRTWRNATTGEGAVCKWCSLPSASVLAA